MLDLHTTQSAVRLNIINRFNGNVLRSNYGYRCIKKICRGI